MYTKIELEYLTKYGSFKLIPIPDTEGKTKSVLDAFVLKKDGIAPIVKVQAMKQVVFEILNFIAWLSRDMYNLIYELNERLYSVIIQCPENLDAARQFCLDAILNDDDYYANSLTAIYKQFSKDIRHLDNLKNFPIF